MTVALVVLYLLGAVLMAGFLLFGAGLAENLSTAGPTHFVLFTGAVTLWPAATLVILLGLLVSVEKRVA